MQRDFGGVIWTNHAIERMKDRKIKQGDAWSTWKRPDVSEYNKVKGVWVYKRTYPGEKIEVVAKKNEKGEWIILSVWNKYLNTSGSMHSKKSLIQFLRSYFKPSRA